MAVFLNWKRTAMLNIIIVTSNYSWWCINSIEGADLRLLQSYHGTWTHPPPELLSSTYWVARHWFGHLIGTAWSQWQVILILKSQMSHVKKEVNLESKGKLSLAWLSGMPILDLWILLSILPAIIPLTNSSFGRLEIRMPQSNVNTQSILCIPKQ